MHYLNSLNHYLSWMLILSTIGTLLFLPLSTIEETLGVNNQSLRPSEVTNEQFCAIHTRAETQYVMLNKPPIRTCTYDANDFPLEDRKSVV